MTADQAQAIGANEMGEILVRTYYNIGSPEDSSTRTPQHFQQDIALLKSKGYYPIDLRDLAAGNIDIPAGKSPVVITFDGSSPGQYRLADDGSLDPQCAVAIMQQAANAGGWAQRATFFPLIDVTPAADDIFGQPEIQREKLRTLIEWGYEVGSQTTTDLDLMKASVQDATKELAESKATLEQLIGGGYAVTSLAVPFGDYPASDALLTAGEYQGKTYAYTAAVAASGGPSPSPFSSQFNPLHIKRIVVTGNALQTALAEFQKHPELRYVSDGDPTTVSAPKSLSPQLGQLRSDLGRPVVRY